MVFMTFHSVGNFIIPTDEIHHFQRGRYTTNQLFMIDQIRLTTVGFTVDISDGAITTNIIQGGFAGTIKMHVWMILAKIRMMRIVITEAA